MAERTTVIVVDDHSLFRAGVVQTLQMDAEIEVVGEGGSAQDTIDLVTRLRPDIVLLDVRMPGNGIDAARKVLRIDAGSRIVMLTVSEEEEDVMKALEIGAVGYVLKGIRANELIDAVKSVAAGETFVSPNLTLRILKRVSDKTPASLLSTLTRQEERTLRLIASGLSNREIGLQLGIVEKTVKYHVTRILAKLKVRNRVEATLIAERGWSSATKPSPLR